MGDAQSDRSHDCIYSMKLGVMDNKIYILSLTGIITLFFYLYMVFTFIEHRIPLKYYYNIIVDLKYQDGSSNHLHNAYFEMFFSQLGWMTLNLQLPQGITLGMAFRYTFIRMSYSIILLMIEVIIRKKYWFSIQVILS